MNTELTSKKAAKSKWFIKIKQNADLIINHIDRDNLIRLLEISVANIDFSKPSHTRDELLIIDTLMYIKSYFPDKYFLYLKSKSDA